ncbi:MAG: DinB family protein [Blastocatellia bacterium]|nr:DinB family protein [Blastocatellia bacterium]
MVIETLKTLYARDLNKLKSEIEAYKSEDAIWKKSNEIPNSAGNLTLHLMGNLNAFIGAEIGKTGYIRQRDLEFSTEFELRNDLIKRIEDVINIVDSTLSAISAEDLEKEYPLVVFQDKMTTGFFLIHLATHLSYHLGQINYHRRLLDEG